jgi:formate dehydrogenase subunit gamma
MAKLLARFRYIAGAIMLLVAFAVVTPVSAQQPSSVNPTAQSVKEDQLFQQLRQLDGRVSIPNPQAGVLIQPAGRDWRQFHQQTLHWIGGIAIIGMLAVLIVF